MEEPKAVEILNTFAEGHKLKFFKTSAKTGLNVEIVMKELIALIDEEFFKDPMKIAAENMSKSQRVTLKPRSPTFIESIVSYEDPGDTKKKKKCCLG